MKLQHYLGGLEGLPEPLSLEKRVFVEDWEKRIFGIHVAMMGLSKHLDSALPAYPIADVPTTFKDEWTWASLRTGAEAMNPFDYFKFRYYEKWLGGISQFFVDQGYVTEEEIAAIIADPKDAPGGGDPAIDDQVIDYLRRGDSPRRDVAHPAFSVGQQVRIADLPAGAHTRLPGYLRARTGTVTRIFEGDYGYFVHTGDGIGDPMPIYIVEFTPEELWGVRAEPGANSLYAELFEAYLQPIEEDK
ncbi:nitrile hydratase subunit beta [Mycolicibacterium diernhoferi]|uniref:nitrile hydratase n=1 Tax=Mycolicibacterium diernhoferi TaxID=1801 RepID=A0A1Q4H647_9MYCO|nr:nitrile hydratase subunit beta [Mycolicibacterium diernhoferi]OJZ62912.1 nitrile hydratase subunit beta [Mycolicibacterium diernhoferi]OPE54944.1 nitrile hydratase subunit beta [Mycolicibacterium diernhoferi]PEG54732.1 nitrile hydratase subunit beta [Mycolicibacterium diernhoferi]QYL22951.1 nitrile hydratase subunit beta [Mycolicibacterium diernhoferi]